MLILIVAAVILAFFWKTVLRVAIAALLIGFVFLCVTGVLDTVHGLHTLIP